MGVIMFMSCAALCAVTDEAGAAIAKEGAETNLAACPDCLKMVSKRALMCPGCGCPGNAIFASVQRAELLAKPKSVVQVVADKTTGFGVGIVIGDQKYVVLDVFLLADSTSLELRDVVNQINVPYTTIQLAEGAGLMRLQVNSDALAYAPITKEKQAATRYLDEVGLDTTKESGVLGLSAKGEACELKSQKRRDALNQSMRWRTVRPKELREQLNLLVGLLADQPSLDSELESIQWLTPYFKEIALNPDRKNHL